jgi:hypothetical protein
MSPEFNVMLESAREYCEVIETAGENRDEWLDRISALLPRLHAAVSALEMNVENDGVPTGVDLEARFELFSKLHQLLGEKDSYWLVYDAKPEGNQQMCGSLADDLTDIYCELKHGLAIFDSDSDADLALCNWHQGFRMHWGQHLVDAERHLYELSAQGNLNG